MTLFKHQQDAVDFAIKMKGRCAIYHEMGLGKTRTAIEILKEIKKRRPEFKMFVIAPLTLLESAWHEDIERFSDFKFWNLRKDRKISTKQANDTDVFALNFESLRRKETLFAINILTDMWPFLCVVDESSKMKIIPRSPQKRFLN